MPPEADATTTTRIAPASFPATLTPRTPTGVRFSDVREPVHLARTVTDLFNADPHVLQNRHVEVRQRRALRITNIATALDARGLAANQRNREIVVEMRIAVADAGPIQEQCVVEHRAVALGQLRQLVDQIRELPHVILVDLVQSL